MQQPKTLEEALGIIAKLTGERDEAQKQFERASEDKKKILQEKKDLMTMFSEKEKDEMSDSERKLAEALEKERSERKALEDSIKAESDARNKAENDRVQKWTEERITRVSKGDTKIADQLRANIAMLDKMPRGSESEIDSLMNTAYNMMGREDVNPFAAANASSGGTPSIDEKPKFSETEKGKEMGSKLGLSFTAEANKGGEGK